jgi:hypothetical protein
MNHTAVPEGLSIDSAHLLIVHDRDAMSPPAVDDALRSMRLRVLTTSARVPTRKRRRVFV